MLSSIKSPQNTIVESSQKSILLRMVSLIFFVFVFFYLIPSKSVIFGACNCAGTYCYAGCTYCPGYPTNQYAYTTINGSHGSCLASDTCQYVSNVGHPAGCSQPVWSQDVRCDVCTGGWYDSAQAATTTGGQCLSYNICSGGSPPGGGGETTLVNCSGVSVVGTKDTSGDLIKGNTYTITANYDFNGQGTTKNQVMLVRPGSTGCNAAVAGTTVALPGAMSLSWTPNAVGTYIAYCLTSAAGYASCTGYSKACDTTTDYVCNGPGASVVVNVVDPAPVCSVAGPSSVTTQDNPTYSVSSSTNAGSTGIYKNPPSSWPTICASAGNCSGTTNFASVGTYWVVCNAYNGTIGTSPKCSGAPGTLPSGWTDCGSSSRMQVTVTNPPVNGGWTGWGACSVTACGSTGTQTRTCTNPSPQYGGSDCSGLDGGNSSKPCSTVGCPTAWCTVDPVSCGGNPGITLHSTYGYYCVVDNDSVKIDEGYFGSGTYPAGPQTPGAHQGEVYCYNYDSNNSKWYGSGWNTCNYNVPAPTCNSCLSGCCTSASCGGGNCVPPVTGVCNTWSGWSACSSCSQTRTRTYTPPSCGGSNVSCPLSESQACGDVNAVCSDWSGWSACSSCSQTRTRTKTPASCGGSDISCPPESRACGDVNGVCGAAHYSCSVGTSTNNVDGASAWTWNCNGSCAGGNPSCSENKPTAWCTVSPNPLPNSGNPGITLYSTNASYCYVEHDWSLVREGYFTSGTYYPGAQTTPGNHQGEVFCYNSNWNGSGWNTCNYTVNPPPSCTVSIPADTVKIGETKTLTATTTQANGTISKVDFSSNNGNATVSPATDTTSPYATAVTGISTGTSTITGTATVSNGIITATCTDTAIITVPACTVSLAPAAKTLTVGDVFAFAATLTNIIPSSVSFSSNTPGSVSVNPASDTTSPYTTNATAVSPTGATLTASAIYNGVAKCSGTSNISVNAKSWWQVKNGDVTTNGDISSIVPPTTVLYFDTIGAGGYPGIPAYGGTTNLNGANVSVRGWLAASGYNATKIYNSAYFLNAKPSDVTPKQVGPSITSADFDFKAANSWYGYYWYEYDGTNPVTINGNIDFGTKKVILLVKQVNVTLNGKINLTDGQGFFMLAVGGNITIDPSLGGTPPQAAPNLEGIFISDGQFQTGTTASGTDPQLWVRGTVAAYGGVSLQRFLGSANLTTPAELFEYAPDLDLLFPGILGARTMNWREVAP